MIILIASLRFVGYFLSKFFGTEKSLLLSGIIGGFVSSTAVTMSVSEQSQNKKIITPFLIPIFLASALMFFRVILEIRITAHSDLELFWKTFFPLLSGGIVFLGAALLVFISRRKKHQSHQIVKTPIHIEQPLRMKSALSFGAFFLLILFLSEKIATFLPSSALLAVGALTGITDVDSITLSISQVQKSGEISATLAAHVILIAVLVNTLVKAGIVFLIGSRALFRGVSVSILIAVLVGGGVMLWS